MNQPAATREARLRAEYRVLYPQLEPGVWTPAAKMVEQALSASSSARGVSRVLNDHHFEFRGSSSREPGGPIGLSRMTDAVAGEHTVGEERAEREHRLAAREREADQGIQRAEELQARVDQVTEEIDRLRQQVDRPGAGTERESRDRQPDD
jgi:hypothetical protein